MVEALLDDTAVSTGAVYQPQSAKPNHLRRSCISPARYGCISTALKKKPEAKVLLDDTAVSNRAVSTAINDAKTYLTNVYITNEVRQPR